MTGSQGICDQFLIENEAWKNNVILGKPWLVCYSGTTGDVGRFFAENSADGSVDVR